MTDGLKLTFSGEELRKLLEGRANHHQRCADRWTHETERTPEDQTEEEPLLPTQMCENEAERHVWRAEVLRFISDHTQPAETYRLSAADLEFGELLPPKPAWLEQDEYEERTRLGFTLERVVKSIDGLAAMAGFRSNLSQRYDTVGESDEFKTTPVDTNGGPEAIMIERK